VGSKVKTTSWMISLRVSKRDLITLPWRVRMLNRTSSDILENQMRLFIKLFTWLLLCDNIKDHIASSVFILLEQDHMP
jgi:hypothetical protein